ncbi:MAG TPA: ArsA-related P-loop ATPase [Bdellovibrionota bacterium]|nr:ArsA-related P-loop ATPase [Bdellovibrionota bacterium]
MSKESSPTELLREKSLVVVGGVGGVGKTTLAAAVGLHAALDGRRVAILTIDPAQRLGAALGFRTLGNRLRHTPPKKLDPWRRKTGGSLAACMLDVKATFDGMVGRYAPSATLRDRILASPFYRELSEAMAGTHEYMALEKIYELHALQEFDLVILDTPPASALADFFEAPSRIVSFLDRDVVQWFLSPKRKGIAGFAIGKGMDWALSMLDRLAGGTVLEDIAGFLRDFQNLFDGFRERTRTVDELLQSGRTGFLLVSSADELPWQAALKMADDLRRHRRPLLGLILNRMLPDELPKAGNAMEEKLLGAAHALHRRQIRIREEAKSRFSREAIFEVRLSDRDPATIQDLARLSFTSI